MHGQQATSPQFLLRSFGLLTALLSVTVTALACTADPAVLKQQYLDSGNQYFDQEKYAEAIKRVSQRSQDRCHLRAGAKATRRILCSCRQCSRSVRGVHTRGRLATN